MESCVGVDGIPAYSVCMQRRYYCLQSSLQGSSSETRPKLWHVTRQLLYKPDMQGSDGAGGGGAGAAPTSACFPIQINNLPRTGLTATATHLLTLGDNELSPLQAKKRACPRTRTAIAAHALLRRSLMHSTTCSLCLSAADDQGAGHASHFIRTSAAR